MGGVGDKLPLPLQIFHKGPYGPLGEEKQQDEDNQCACQKDRGGNPQYVVGLLELEKAVQHNYRTAAAVTENAETVVIHIPPILSGVNDPADGIHCCAAVQGGDMVQIDRFHFSLLRQLRNKIAGLKRGLRRDLKVAVRGIKMGTQRVK